MKSGSTTLNTGFAEIDDQFARFMESLSGAVMPPLYAAAKLVSRGMRDGHICIALPSLSGSAVSIYGTEQQEYICPQADEWAASLASAPVVGRPGERKPLILDTRFRLYLHRYWDYERELVDEIRRRTALIQDCFRVQETDGQDETVQAIREALSLVFGGKDDDVTRLQKAAAVTVLLKQFVVITGSPGTGKTTLVARILMMMQELAGVVPLRMALAAPTGKAAVRLQESARKANLRQGAGGTVKAAVPENAFTIHRLLGVAGESSRFRYNRENRLPYDIIVIDEASMIDLPLLARLMQALHDEAKLVLLGDRDQLASVEAGSVLGDICGSADTDAISAIMVDRISLYAGFGPAAGTKHVDTGIHDSIISLRHNFRFGEQSGIGRLSSAVNDGDGDAVMRVLRDDQQDDVRLHEIPGSSGPYALRRYLKKCIAEGFSPYLDAVLNKAELQELFALFDRFRILCALRQGPFGAGTVNSHAEAILGELRLIDTGMIYYAGRPVMVTKNDYHLGLFNGDVGLVLPDDESRGEMRVFFRDAGGNIRRFHPLRLPEHETVYAMTIHKSQGSEFETVAVVLPDRDAPVLTRELFYTGITRARKSVEIWGTEGILRTAVTRRTERTSGLREALWG